VLLQPIRVETSPGRTEAAILHMADMEECRHRDQRLAAMLDRSPIHTVLFSRSGKVLCANKAAGTKIESVHAGQCLHSLASRLHCMSSYMALCRKTV